MQSPTPTVAATPRPLQAIRALAFCSLLALIVLDVVWDLALAQIKPSGLWTVLKVLPLCAAIPGLLRHRMYTYRWMSLLVWLYFIEGVVRTWVERGLNQWLAGVEILLCLALFAACGVHVRERLGWGRKVA
ncbi:MAG: DUF2069 domain-containing protein [Ramlibacter sp.]